MSELEERYRPMIEHQREQALAELEDLVRRDPGSIEAHALLAVAYQRCMDFAACAAAARAVIALQPDHREALHQLALSHTMLGDNENALAAFQEAWRSIRTTTAGIGIGLTLHRLGRLDEAREHLEELLRLLNPDTLHVWPTLRALMRVNRDQGRVLEADHYAHWLVRLYQTKPVSVASHLVDREQASTFPEWVRLTEKGRLAEFLMGSRQGDPAGRFPESFDLPRERAALAAFAAANPGVYLIAKPVRGSGGQGISVTDEVSDVIDRTEVVVQRYIHRPYLIDGRKGHLRIYGLITSIDPLRAYVFEEGIVRFAPEPYDLSPERLSEVSMHVTNTALHKGHPGLVISQDADVDDSGSIWSLSAVLRRIAADGHDPEAVLCEIRDLIGWFLRQTERDGLFMRQAAAAPRRAFGPKLLGFDVLLDEDAHPWLIEIQTSPAATGAPLVNKINSELFRTIFDMSVTVAAHDGMSAAELAALRDPAGLSAREAELEVAARGRFRPIWG